MKTLVSALVLSASFLGAASVQAGELDWPPEADTTSTLSRAEVRAELLAARDQGLVPNGEQAYPAAGIDGQAAGSHATASREQVRQELAEARAAGELTTGEQSYPPVEG